MKVHYAKLIECGSTSGSEVLLNSAGVDWLFIKLTVDSLTTVSCHFFNPCPLAKPNTVPPIATKPPIFKPARRPTGPPMQVPIRAPVIGYMVALNFAARAKFCCPSLTFSKAVSTFSSMLVTVTPWIYIKKDCFFICCFSWYSSE